MTDPFFIIFFVIPFITYIAFGIIGKLIFKLPVFVGLVTFSVVLGMITFFLAGHPMFAMEGGIILIIPFALSVIGLAIASLVGVVEMIIYYLTHKKSSNK